MVEKEMLLVLIYRLYFGFWNKIIIIELKNVMVFRRDMFFNLVYSIFFVFKIYFFIEFVLCEGSFFLNMNKWLVKEKYDLIGKK